MKYALYSAVVLLVWVFCSPDTMQEAISGCDIEEGKLGCFDLKNSCTEGYSEWTDTEATDQTKCQCCEKK